MEDQGLLVRLPGRLLLDKPPVSVDANKAGGRVPLLRGSSAGGGVDCGNGNESLLERHEFDFSGNFVDAAAHETASQNKRIAGSLEVRGPDVSKKTGAAAAHATAGESDRNLGNSSWDLKKIKGEARRVGARET